MRTGLILITALFLQTISASATDNKRLDSENETRTQQTNKEATDQPTVQVNKEMLKRFEEYKQNGSNTTLNWQLLRGYDFKTATYIIEDYNTITTRQLTLDATATNK